MSTTIIEIEACACLHVEKRVPGVGFLKSHRPGAICPWAWSCQSMTHRPGKVNHAQVEDYTDYCDDPFLHLINMCYKASKGNPDVR